MYTVNKNQINLIIQVTTECNLRCLHCYEADGGFPRQRMTPSILRKLFYKLSLEYKRVSICWFGGEPLIGGLDFFKEALRLEREKHFECGMEFRNSIQSNGVLLTDEMIDFFQKNNIKISFSYDCEYNDILRQHTAETVNAILRCRQRGMNVGIISVIHKMNFRYQKEMIDTCNELGVSYKFNRIFSEGKASNSTFLINNEDYVTEMKKLFKKWLFEDSSKPFRTFSIVLDSLYGQSGRECVYNGCMFKWLALSPSGEVYTCPRFFNTDLSLGNFNEYEKISDIFYSNRYTKIVEKTLKRIKECAKNCNVFEFCLGGCNAQSYFSKGLEKAGTDLCYYTKEIMPFIATEVYNAFVSKAKVNKYVNEIFINNPQGIFDVYDKLKK